VVLGTQIWMVLAGRSGNLGALLRVQRLATRDSNLGNLPANTQVVPPGSRTSRSIRNGRFRVQRAMVVPRNTGASQLSTRSVPKPQNTRSHS